jgi:hypothetical protein
MKYVAQLIIVVALGLSQSAFSAHALTLEQMRGMPNMTPDKFMKLFADFEFKFHEEVQDHRVFLATKSGDCDDFATLAADILRRHGYTPRMIAVRMKGETHVVCYIPETRSYLDYNFRKDPNPLIPSDGSLTDVARKVAQSFGRDWIATYEFTFRDGIKRLVNNIIPNRSLDRSS